MARATSTTKVKRRRIGSPYQRKSDGRWVATLRVRDPYTGVTKPVTRYAHPNTAEAAEMLLAEMIAEYRKGLPVHNDRVKLRGFVEKWLRDVVKPSVSPQTYAVYERQMRNHVLSSTLADLPLREIGPQHVHDWQLGLQRKGLDERYVGDLKGLLKRCLRQAEAWNLVARNAAASVKPPRRKSAEMQVWTADQVRAFLQFIRLDRPRREALYAMCLTLGLRQGEVFGLWWGDVDFDRATVTISASLKPMGKGKGVERGEVKTPSARRTLELPRSLVVLLRMHRNMQQEERRLSAALGQRWPGGDWVFPTVNGTPYLNSRIVTMFHADIRRANGAGLELPQIPFHSLRHSAASLLYQRGVPLITISKVLGHRSPQITANVYTHIFQQSYKEAADVMDDLLGGLG